MRNALYKMAGTALSKLFRTPPYIILFVSDKCANHCSHCWYGAEWKEKNLTSKVLTFEELEKLSRKTPGIKFITITGGEAFLRDDLEEIVQAFAVNSRAKRIDVPTSGFNPEMIARKTENILKANPNTPFRVDVSIDGTKETHNKVRRNPGSYDAAVQTITDLLKLKERYSKLDVSVITTISDANAHDISSTAELISSILPRGEWMVNMVRGDSPGRPVSEDIISAYIEADRIISDRVKKGRFTGDSGHSLGRLLSAKNATRRKIILDVAQSKIIGGGCAAGCLTVAILTTGEVRACEMLPLSLGNLRDFDYDLKKMVSSANAKEIRRKIIDDECICTHECNLSVSILLRPSFLARFVLTTLKGL